MAFDFNKIKDDIISAGKDVGAKAKDVSATAKIKLDISSKESFLQKQYAELGRVYFEAHKDEEDVAEKEAFDAIKDILRELDDLKEQLLDKQGSVVCPNCGEKQSMEASFCSKCGASLVEKVDAEFVEEE